MSHSQINLSPDLKKLMDEGYEVEIIAGYLVLRNVPYVNSRRKVKRGSLISTLDLSGNVTIKPATHIAMFDGEHPCDREGNELKEIKHASTTKWIHEDLVGAHSFSAKPGDGNKEYEDYFHKMSTYANIISAPAQTIDPNATAQTHRVIESYEDDSVFEYIDTASSRAGITMLSEKLKHDKIAIIGLGGTGAYVLDFVAKTSAREIHLFDGDDLLQHNAFRSPGAPSIEDLRANLKKVDYHLSVYERM